MQYHFEGFQRAVYHVETREISRWLSGSNAENVVLFETVRQFVPQRVVHVVGHPLQSECNDRWIVAIRQKGNNAD